MPDEGVFKGYLRKTRARATGRSRRIRRSCASVWEVDRGRLARRRSGVGLDQSYAPPPQRVLVGQWHSGSANRPAYRHCCDDVRLAVHLGPALALPARSRSARHGRGRDHDRRWQPARPAASLRNGQPRAALGPTHAGSTPPRGQRTAIRRMSESMVARELLRVRLSCRRANFNEAAVFRVCAAPERVRRLKGQVEASDCALEAEADFAEVTQLVVSVRGAANSSMPDALEDHIGAPVSNQTSDPDPVRAQGRTADRRRACLVRSTLDLSLCRTTMLGPTPSPSLIKRSRNPSRLRSPPPRPRHADHSHGHGHGDHDHDHDYGHDHAHAFSAW